MAADDTTTQGQADLETTHLNPVLDSTVLDTTSDSSGGQAGAAEEPEEEWPPRAWRETTRAAGHRQALYVALGMVAIFAVLIVIAIWASHNG